MLENELQNELRKLSKSDSKIVDFPDQLRREAAATRTGPAVRLMRPSGETIEGLKVY